MRRWIVMLSTICVISFYFISPTQAEDFLKGFGGIEWGASITSQVGLKVIGTKDDVIYYQNPNRLYDIDGEQLEKVIYGFYKQSFFASYIDIDTPAHFSKIRSKLQAMFGDFKIIKMGKEDLTVYRWMHKDLKIKLKHWETSGKMKLAFYYVPISSQINEDEQEIFQEKSIRFVPVELDKKPDKWILFKW